MTVDSQAGPLIRSCLAPFALLLDGSMHAGIVEQKRRHAARALLPRHPVDRPLHVALV